MFHVLAHHWHYMHMSMSTYCLIVHLSLRDVYPTLLGILYTVTGILYIVIGTASCKVFHLVASECYLTIVIAICDCVKAVRSLSHACKTFSCLQVKGKENAVKLVETLQPSIVIPLINAQFHQSGPLSKLIHAEGSPDDLEEQLRQHGMKNVSVRMPAAPGKALSMAL